MAFQGVVAVSLFSFLVTIFTKIFEWCLAFFGKRLAMATTIGVTFIAGWVAVQASIYALWTGLGFVMPEKVSLAMPYVVALLPPNLIACFAAVVAGKLLMWLWRVQSDWLRMIMAAK